MSSLGKYDATLLTLSTQRAGVLWHGANDVRLFAVDWSGQGVAEATTPDARSAGSKSNAYGIPAEDAADAPITGTRTQAAERFAACAVADATWLVWGTIATTGTPNGS